MMEFLYFPQDKTEYIPAFITLVFFAIGAIITTRIMFKAAKKEEQQTNELYKHAQVDSEKDTEHKPS